MSRCNVAGITPTLSSISRMAPVHDINIQGVKLWIRHNHFAEYEKLNRKTGNTLLLLHGSSQVQHATKTPEVISCRVILPGIENSDIELKGNTLPFKVAK